MCSTSCPLTESPAAYIWYKNREFLYQDWSPWYQHLVSSEEAVRYSCAIKGYEDLRAPEVSVDSVTSACFTVTYAKGRMCSYEQKSVDEPCSITYPREIHVQRRATSISGHVKLACNTSCSLTDHQTAFTWYMNRNLDRKHKKPHFVIPNTSADSFSCAVKGPEDLHSAEVCAEDKNCWSVNYVRRRICALKGSTVNISSQYSHPSYQQPESKSWYKIKRALNKDPEKLTDLAGHVQYNDKSKNHHILTINNLKKNDSAEYTFRLQEDEGWKQSDLPGVILVVTGLKVTFAPSAVVTEGQRVTLTCSTSCPLTDITNYMWYLNSRPLTLPQNQNKHLVLDSVSSQHAGNYSCAVKTPQNISSHEKTLTVHTTAGTTWKAAAAAAAGVCAVLLILIPFSVILWIRRKRSSFQSHRAETSDNLEQLNPDEISAQPTEQEDLHYSTVHFPQKHTDSLDSTVQTQQPQQQEHVLYAAANFRADTAPE
ncbi:uncharacterized protein LOC143319796 [Chaetodon auriga]|uniref:uncharacterized protein LOC143319796 n=1 Tax=Chaetodon auriga TaxID=39042 RepID=UPI004032BF01